MKIAVITVAGKSSRFNDGIPEENRKLKAVYYEENYKNTLLFHLLLKCDQYDKIILVGGYKLESLKNYLHFLEVELRDRIIVVKNDHYEDLSSGYSLYLGLEETFRYDPSEILFMEGDLDFDDKSFKSVIYSQKSVLTYTYEPIYANKAVVLYKDDKERYQYAFNSSHGFLSIDSPVSCILNSGQTWKFTEIDKLKTANDWFYEYARNDINLSIIQKYLDLGVDVDIILLERWTNCNTREDYRKIVSYWKG